MCKKPIRMLQKYLCLTLLHCQIALAHIDDLSGKYGAEVGYSLVSYLKPKAYQNLKILHIRNNPQVGYSHIACQNMEA